MPSGGLEPGETPQQGAERELCPASRSTYRVTGNAAATGEAAGMGAAVAPASERLPH
jgi:hypothetical protein